MTQCNATAELMDASMQVVPGITLRCDYELGHPDDHSVTLRWADPTVDELREVLDPDESFDLEVDIAPAEVIEHQARVTADAEPVEPIPEALYRCGACGRELVPASLLNSLYGWAHAEGVLDHAAYLA